MMTAKHWRMNMSNIEKQIASVTQLHGGEREQASKYRAFLAWQLARSKAERAYNEIVKSGHLEDRMEYDVEMLAKMYELTKAEAEHLLIRKTN
jgi:hypothetical protein